LEQAVKLSILWGLLAVRYALGCGAVARLLCKDLCELDHVRIVVELLGKIDHLISAVLLVTRARSSEEGPSPGDSDGIALFASASSITSIFPFLSGVDGGLCDAFGVAVRRGVHRRRCCGESEEEGGEVDHSGNKGARRRIRC